MASPSPSTWHTISPSTRPLSLSILELTPLALTLSLTLAIPTSSSSSSSQALHTQQQQLHPSSPSAALHHHRRKKRHPHTHTRGRIDSDDETAVEIDESDSPLPGSWPILNGEVRFKDLLSHGVVVSVNGQPWNRIVAHVSDEDDLGEGEEEEEWEADDEGGTGTGEEEGNTTRRRPRKARFSLSAGHAAREAGLAERRKREKKSQGDRAVVVVYGLSPGKEYEIELRVVGMFGDGADGIGTYLVVGRRPIRVWKRSRLLMDHSVELCGDSSIAIPESRTTPEIKSKLTPLTLQSPITLQLNERSI